MQEESRNCGCNNNFANPISGMFGGCDDNCTILFFIIVFLLLFTNFGNRRGC